MEHRPGKDNVRRPLALLIGTRNQYPALPLFKAFLDQLLQVVHIAVNLNWIARISVRRRLGKVLLQGEYYFPEECCDLSNLSVDFVL